MIDTGAYEQKAVPGPIVRKLVTLWLYWTPKQPPKGIPVESTPRKPKREKMVRKEGKAGRTAWEEPDVKVKVELDTMVGKSGRPVSAELSASNRNVRAVTRGQAAKATLLPIKIKEEDFDNDFVSVEEALRGTDMYGRDASNEECGIEATDEI